MELFRAWRFDLPVFEETTTARVRPAGLGTTATGAIAMVAERDAVRQSILLLLATKPGERIMRPAYGCNLDRICFAPNDETTAGLAIYFVSRALATWEPRAEVLSLDARRDADVPSRLIIELRYRVRGFDVTEDLAVPFNLTPEASDAA